MRIKENIEWMQSWCDTTGKNDLPRVLLVGDSITRGYEKHVRAKLEGVCYVDYVSTSYSIDSPIYNKMIKAFIDDSEYDVIHFNHGLHGINMQKRTYKSCVKKLLNSIGKSAEIILATSTLVYRQGTKIKDGAWMKCVRERNDAMREIAAEKGYALDDLFQVSKQIPFESRSSDGTHYTTAGYLMLTDAVVESVKEKLK